MEDAALDSGLKGRMMTKKDIDGTNPEWAAGLMAPREAKAKDGSVADGTGTGGAPTQLANVEADALHVPLEVRYRRDPPQAPDAPAEFPGARKRREQRRPPSRRTECRPSL